MRGDGQHSGRWARFASLVLALALFAGRLVPGGYMLDPSGPGGGLVVCTGAGPLRLPDPAHPGRNSRPAVTSACLSAAGAAALSGPRPAERIARLARPRLADRRVLPPRAAPVSAIAAPPPPARGPPGPRQDTTQPAAPPA